MEHPQWSARLHRCGLPGREKRCGRCQTPTIQEPSLRRASPSAFAVSSSASPAADQGLDRECRLHVSRQRDHELRLTGSQRWKRDRRRSRELGHSCGQPTICPRASYPARVSGPSVAASSTSSDMFSVNNSANQYIIPYIFSLDALCPTSWTAGALPPTATT